MNRLHREMQVTFINENRIWNQVLKIVQDMDIIDLYKQYHLGSNNYILKNNYFALKYE